MYDQPPYFSTGRGWKYGRFIGTLSQGITIYVCQEAKAGFGFSTQRWYQIAYWGGMRDAHKYINNLLKFIGDVPLLNRIGIITELIEKCTLWMILMILHFS